jgi:hypothetical protein
MLLGMWHRVVAIVVATGCGATIARAPLTKQTQDGFLDVAARQDVDGITARLGDPFQYAGMYFADPACAQKFAAPRAIAGAERRAFAECLAQLQLRQSPREDDLFGVAVFDYAPGIEIEAVFRARLEGARLAWIGYAGRRAAADAAPTVSPGTLEITRLEGDFRAAPPEADAAALVAENTARGWKHAFAWMNVCLDATGTITGVHTREASSPLAERTFRAAIANWKFGPPKLGDAPTAVCAMYRFVHPETEDPEVLPIDFPVAEGTIRVPRDQLQRVAGEVAIAPDALGKKEMVNVGVETLVGAFRYCVDVEGKVTDVAAIESTGIASYDARLVAGIKQWRYKPFLVDDKPVVACTAATFVYNHQP